MCVSEGFPALPFFIDRDITRDDGLIQCRELSTAEFLLIGKKLISVARILAKRPIIY